MATILKTTRIAALFIAAPLSFSSAANAAEGEGWDWIVAPYFWAVNINTDVETHTPPSSASSDLTFGDVLDKFDGAFQLHVEGQGEGFGAFADFTYLGLSDGNERPRFRTESDFDTRLFEIAAVWPLGEERFRGADVFAGLRYVDMDLTLQLIPTNPAFGRAVVDGSDSYSDLMLGARYTWVLSERWGMTLRGDTSFGQTEGTWNASAVANYRTQNGAWFFGYRYLVGELESGNGNATIDINLYGPEVGYGFKF